MNISYNWLKDLIDLDLTAEETAAALTRVGLAVEGIHRHGEDWVLDIDLTSNRPDCLSHLGVARELSVSTGNPVKVEKRRSDDRLPDAPFPSLLAPDVVRIQDADLCHRFTARIIRNVKIGPSPDWMVQRLEAIGERSINNVADITNYVMHELGQPMHSFDLDRLSEKRLVVRRAIAGETIKTLDEVDRQLDETMLAICDAERPVAVAGIMGGLESSITDSTVNVLLEVAYFDRASIRKTSRALGLATEASYHFERGVDIENLKNASDRATKLICELAGGEASEFVDIYPTHSAAVEVTSPDVASAVRRLTGLDVPIEECLRILSALGITPQLETEQRSQVFIAPSWRHDIAIEEDLVEEIARHVGYENIKEELPPAFGAGEYQATEARKKLIRRTLADAGYDEAIGYSFIDTGHDDVFATVPGLSGTGDHKFVTLRDSVIEGAVRMRPTLIPGLLEAVRHNLNHQRRDLRMFELGKAFSSGGEGKLPVERQLFAVALTGGLVGEGRQLAARELDFYDAKGAVEAALETVGISSAAFAADDVAHLRRGQAASIKIGPHIVGSVGRINEEIASNYKFKQPVYVAEIDLQAVLEQAPEPVRYTPLPKYPSVVRDVSFVVDRSMEFEAIRSIVLRDKPEMLSSISFVDVFEGKGLSDNERSLTVRFAYRSPDRTLVEQEVSDLHDAIVATLESELGVTIRK